MTITVEYHAQARTAIGSAKETIEIGSGATLSQLLDRLTGTHGEAIGSVLQSSLIFLGDRQVRPDSQQKLRNGDILTLVSPISGG